MCSVEKTICPVSAAVMAALMVSRSRISPTSIASGSCRSTCFRPDAKEVQSCPISRCVITDFLLFNSYSIGSSSVMMRLLYLLFIASIIDASVVLLPDPVGPVTSTSPLGRSVSSESFSGRQSCFSVGTVDLMIRNAMHTEPLS